MSPITNVKQINIIMGNEMLFNDGECPICYTAPVGKANPPCGHVCCYQCLKNWSKYRTICPVCTQEFSKIITNNGKTVEAVERAITRSPHVQFLLKWVPVLLLISIALLMMTLFCFPFSKLSQVDVTFKIVTFFIYSTFVYCDVRRNNDLPQFDRASLLYYSIAAISLSMIAFIVSWILLYITLDIHFVFTLSAGNDMIMMYL